MLVAVILFFMALTAFAATQNAANQKYANNADGFSLGGGTTARTLAVTGGDVTLTGAAGGYTYNFPVPTRRIIHNTGRY
jgi:hypothetical protein